MPLSISRGAQCLCRNLLFGFKNGTKYTSVSRVRVVGEYRLQTITNLTTRGRLLTKEELDCGTGNRSALEWVIDQYQVSTDKRSGMVNDPNRADDPEYIVRLMGQVITVSLETMRVIKALLPSGVMAREEVTAAHQ